MAHFNSTQGKIERWLIKQKIGTTFTASAVGKLLNLTGNDIGMFIKWHDQNFRKAGRAPNGSTQIWEIISTEIIPC